MDNIKNERVRRWGLAAVWVGLIFATLPVMRPVCKFLEQYPWYSFVVNGAVLLYVAVFFAHSFRKHFIPSVARYLLLALVLVGYGWGMGQLRIPAERVHFIEYGVLAFLVYRALALDLKSGWSYFWAFVLTSLIGWSDEGTQYLIPGRYYELRDVGLNVISAALGLLLVFTLYKDRRI
jgi:VanZ family protein